MNADPANLGDNLKDFEELTALDGSSELCVFGYCGANLGDHIQTLALLQHVRLRAFVFRDDIRPHRELVLLANGWLTHGEMPRSADFRDIKYVGIHLGHHVRTADVANGLRGSGIIGCRDPVTEAFLGPHGVSATVCGCASVAFPPYKGERENVVCVDLTEKPFQRVTARFRGYGRVLRVTHFLPKCQHEDMTIGRMLAEMKQAYETLQLYRKAKLVVTSRIHAALPCIAFGTPVIVFKSFEDRASVFEGMDVPEGWQQFRWFRMFPWPRRSIPTPIACEQWRSRYLDFLRRALADAPAAVSV